MIQAFVNIWKVKELRNRLLFTVAMLVIYRIGFFIPLPGVDQERMADFAANQEGTALGNLIQFVTIFTGGSFSQSTIFGLGIMPYISAAIIFQLLGAVYEPLKKIQKEGPAGRQKIQEYTRYSTVALCLVQAAFWVQFMLRNNFVYAEYAGSPIIWVTGIFGLTAGTVFLMWLGEQIDKFGIGNGISLIITAGIIATMDDAIMMVVSGFSTSVSGTSQYGWGTVVILVLSFIFVTAGAVIITMGQRRIPIQHAKHTKGRKVYGGQKSYLPLRVNHGGVMPIIFASSLMIFPSMFFGIIYGQLQAPEEGDSQIYLGFYNVLKFLNDNFANMTGYLYSVVYIAMIYFFTYFWTSVQFQPDEVATNLRDSGAFIPGLRPGPRTAEYLHTVMERITYVGAGFLAVIAVIPTLLSAQFGVPFLVTQFLGGTGLLISVSVMLDFVQRIEANLLMRNYEGFLGGGGGGPKIRGSRGPG